MANRPLPNVLALDVGARRIGLSYVSNGLSLPRSLDTLEAGGDIWQRLKDICATHQIEELVIGLPRNLRGEETNQTKQTRLFAKEAEQNLNLPVVLQDEALSSRQAEEVLKRPGNKIEKTEVDAVAASIILEDYLHESGFIR